MNRASSSAALPTLAAVIPAAGNSSRMGECKALLSIGTQTLIRLSAGQLTRAGITEIFVTIHAENVPLRLELEQIPRVTAVIADEQPADMLASLRLGLQQIQQVRRPSDGDGVIVLPSDHPCCRADTLEAMKTAFSDAGRASVIRPGYNGQSGHPILLPWTICRRLPEIPAGHGLNWLFQQTDCPVIDVDVNDPDVTVDLNTRDAFDRWLSSRTHEQLKEWPQ